MGKHAAVAACALVLAMAPRRADACSIAPPTKHEITTGSGDVTPPARVEGTTVSVTRGHGRGGGCGHSSGSSCDDIGSVGFYVTAPADDRSDADHMGYWIALVGGTLPAGVELPAYAVRPYSDGALAFAWEDGATNDQEAVDFTVTISAVDEAGNQGPASEPIHVTDAGGSSGCSATAARASAWPGALLLALALGVLRRRQRKASGPRDSAPDRQH